MAESIVILAYIVILNTLRHPELDSGSQSLHFQPQGDSVLSDLRNDGWECNGMSVIVQWNDGRENNGMTGGSAMEWRVVNLRNDEVHNLKKD
jgi:hypothetical protein